MMLTVLIGYALAAFCVGVLVLAFFKGAAEADYRSEIAWQAFKDRSDDFTDADEALIAHAERVYAGTPSNTQNSAAGGLGRGFDGAVHANLNIAGE